MTTKELYDALVSKPDLHSLPKIYENNLIWHLYNNAYIRAYCSCGDTAIEIFGGNAFYGSIMHWHPDEEDMVNELYTLGKRGNMLVIKKSLFGTSTFYIGPSENYPLSDRREFYFGRKKWDGGQLIYFEQK